MLATKPLPLAAHSFLRRVDPRTKLLLSLAGSAAVMLPLAPLAIFCVAQLGLVLAAGLGRLALRQLVRVTPLLVLLFGLDWFFVGLPFAMLISLRLALLVIAFTLLFATTTADELRRALESARVPRRFAFALATACCALPLLEAEWQGIREAQLARGIYDADARGRGWRHWHGRLTSAVSLVVPAVVMVTQRAWAIHETAALRGLDSPARRADHRDRLSRLDWLLLGGTALLLLGVLSAR